MQLALAYVAALDAKVTLCSSWIFVQVDAENGFVFDAVGLGFTSC